MNEVMTIQVNNSPRARKKQTNKNLKLKSKSNESKQIKTTTEPICLEIYFFFGINFLFPYGKELKKNKFYSDYTSFVWPIAKRDMTSIRSRIANGYRSKADYTVVTCSK
jgi:hypothetical protein